MARVYVSSTCADLVAERRQVMDWLLQADHQPVHSYVADSDTVRDSCLKDIDGCQAYVLIAGFRYGFVPPEDNPERLSITQLEFRRAGSRGLPRVVLMRRNVPDLSQSDVDDEQVWPRLKAFRKEVGDAVRPALFDDAASLISGLSSGLQRALAARPEAGAEPNREARPGRLPEPRLRRLPHRIVGREPLLATLVVELARGRRDFAFQHLPGVGKTALAAELVRQPDLLKACPEGVLWAHLGPQADVQRQLRKWATLLQVGDDAVRACHGPGALSQLVDEAIGERRLLLVVDDVWTSREGQYFLLGGDRCVRVLTTRHLGVAKELMPDGMRFPPVERLSEDDAVALLSQFAPDAARTAPQALRRLAGRLGGLPIALVLAGHLLKADDEGLAGGPPALGESDDIFRLHKLLEFTEEDNLTLGDVIEVSYTMLGSTGTLNRDPALDGELLRATAQAVAVLRPDPGWFPASLGSLVSDAPREALNGLVDAGLLERVEFRGTAASPGAEPHYTMHRLIADHLRRKLSPDRSRALNLRAAEHYAQRLQTLEEAYQHDIHSAYAGMYRYENPEWQDHQDNWLYYLAQSGYDARGVMAFLRAWFDGFWWWGCFLDFGFCDQLLLEWEQRDLPARAQEGLQLLRRFKAAYPKETEDRRGGRWEEVESVLTELRLRVGLRPEPAADETGDATQVRALTDIFLAEAARFGRGDAALAEQRYRSALALFRRSPEPHWNTPWTLYHLADLLLDGGRAAEALALVDEALPLGQAQDDFEVMAQLQRLRGDAAMAAGRAASAADAWFEATALALRFQVDPQDPDPYTIRFYAEIRSHVAERLLQAAAVDLAKARLVAAALRGRWQALGADLEAAGERRSAEPGDAVGGAEPADGAGLIDSASTAEALAARCFPAVITEQQLRAGDVPATEAVRALVGRLLD